MKRKKKKNSAVKMYLKNHCKLRPACLGGSCQNSTRLCQRQVQGRCSFVKVTCWASECVSFLIS